MRVVYCATNTINNKKYIGIDSYWPKRISTHKYYATVKCKNTIFYKAIRKYGWDNFKWEVIKECFSKEELCESEIYYIESKNTEQPNGYNMTKGGEGFFSSHSKLTKARLSKQMKNRIHLINADGTNECVVDVNNVNELLEQGWKRGRLVSHVGSKNSMFGKNHTPNSIKRISEARKASSQTAVCGDIIYATCNDASIINKVSIETIRSWCRTNRNGWSYGPPVSDITE